jgi:hypothetical protein
MWCEVGVARPRKHPETALSSAVKVNLTASEKAKIEACALACDLSIAAYLRRILFDRKITSNGRREAENALLAAAEKLRRLVEQSPTLEQGRMLDRIRGEIEAVAERLAG